MFKINKWFLVFVFTLFVNFVLILFYMNARDGMHVDEQFSYGHSNSSIGAFMFDGIDHHFHGVEKVANKWIDASLYLDYFSVSNENKFSYSNIVENLSKDVHPPLYYIILHTISSVYAGEFSKWFGLSINIVCFLLIAFGIYKLNNLVIGDDKYAFVCLALWGLSNIGLSTILFIRMYALQTFFITMLIYETGRIIKENSVSNKGLFLIFIYSALGILTQYNSIFFSFFIAMFTGVALFFRKNYNDLIKYSIVMLLSVSILFVVFRPASDVLLQSERSQGAFGNIISMLKDPILIFDIEFYRFLKILMYDFWNIDHGVNFILLSFGIIVYRWLKFRKYTFQNKEIKILCNLCFVILLFLAYFGPIGALVLLFLFEKAKNLLLENNKIEKSKNDKENILAWSLGIVFFSSLFIFVTMPFMGSYETRYIMALMPFIAVLSVCVLTKVGAYFKIKEKYWYVFLVLLIILNGVATNFSKESVFRFRNTIETNEFIKKVKGKDIFVISYEKEPLLFFERGFYLKDAKRVYLEPELIDKNLVNELNRNKDDLFVLIQEQSIRDIFFNNPSFLDKNPRMKDILIFISKVTLSERTYDLYQIK